MDLAFPDRLASQFKLADILGYLAPGAAFFISIAAFERWADHILDSATIHLPLSTAYRLVLATEEAKQEWFVYLSIAAVALLFVYITGHVIQSIAVLLLDRLLIYKAYGYPYERLLLEGEDGGRPVDKFHSLPRTFSSLYYRGMFFWTNTYLAFRLSCYIARAIPASYTVEVMLRTASTALGFFLMAAFLFKIIIVPVRKVFQRRHPDTPDLREPGWITTSIRIFSVLLAGPWELLIGKPLSNLINSRRSFDAEFRERYAELFQKTFGLNPHTAESNNYWMAYSYVITHSSKLAAVASHWEMMHTFSRNLAVAFYLAFIYCLCWLHISSAALTTAARGGAILAAIPGVLLLLAASLLLNHYYLYVSYYSKFLYRSFVYLAHTHRTDRSPIVTA